jgi:hypothetical protein
MFSAFTSWGNLTFSSSPPRAQSIYESLVSMNGGNFDDKFSGPMNAEWYAIAMAAGEARDTLERAENQSGPKTVHEMLPVQEGMYGLAPGPYDSANDRRAVLEARYKVALVPSPQNVTQALRLTLGDDFVAWVPNQVTDPSPALIPTALCKDVTARFKVITLRTRVLIAGAPIRVLYEQSKITGGDTMALQDQEFIVVDPGLNGIQEAVKVTAPSERDSSTDPDKRVGEFTATFTVGHDLGAIALTQSFPNWSSYKKNSLVVVKNGKAHDPLIVAKVADLLSRMLGGTSTWDVVQENPAPGSAGPFLVGQPCIGTVPIGLTTYVTL